MITRVALNTSGLNYVISLLKIRVSFVEDNGAIFGPVSRVGVIILAGREKKKEEEKKFHLAL
jgi:hypothetical protein